MMIQLTCDPHHWLLRKIVLPPTPYSVSPPASHLPLSSCRSLSAASFYRSAAIKNLNYLNTRYDLHMHVVRDLPKENERRLAERLSRQIPSGVHRSSSVHHHNQVQALDLGSYSSSHMHVQKDTMTMTGGKETVCGAKTLGCLNLPDFNPQTPSTKDCPPSLLRLRRSIDKDGVLVPTPPPQRQSCSVTCIRLASTRIVLSQNSRSLSFYSKMLSP